MTPLDASTTIAVPTIQQLTPAVLAAIVSSVISLVFRFIPGALKWFDKMEPEQKQLFMLAVTFVVGAFIGLYNMAATGFSQDTLLVLLLTIFASFSSNQTTYSFTKRKPSDNPNG